MSGEGLGLDPENDPVVYTTDYGLDIKFHNAGEGTWKSSLNTSGAIDTAALNGYLYFTAGNYDGVNGLRWVIIGYSTNTATEPVFSDSVNNAYPDASVAANAIKELSSKQLIMVNSYKVAAYSKAVGTTEIPAGCVLCISEKNLLTDKFLNDEEAIDNEGYYYYVRWSLSDIRKRVDQLYKNDISAFDIIRNKIQPVTLTSYSYKKSSTASTNSVCKDISTDHFFLLATSYERNNIMWDPVTYPQNYCIENYLKNESCRISYAHNTNTAQAYFLRTGAGYQNLSYAVSSVQSSGYITHNLGMVYVTYDHNYGVRPCFVLKL